MRLAEVWMDGYKRLFYTHRRDLVVSLFRDEWPHQKTKQSAYAKTKAQISFAVTAKLISVIVFATWIVQHFGNGTSTSLVGKIA